MKSICVLGLGYIGLPTASLFASHGHQVLGVDINAEVVDTVNRGEIHIEEPGLQTLVKAAVHSGHLRAATAPEPADVFIIAVPTPDIPTDGGKRADLSAVEAATRAILPVLAVDNLVILESTSPPGTTRDLVARLVRDEACMMPGQDVFVAHCPERVLPGQILRELIGNDRVAGGVTPRCAKHAADLYRTLIEGECFETDAATAEMAKLMENTYRDVNIALANELAGIAERLGFDANEVIDIANRHPRVNLHRPGVGVGGHCISVDPWFVWHAAPEQARLVRLARDVNDAQPLHVAQRVCTMLDQHRGDRIAVLGVAYKPNVDDVRESPARPLVEALVQAGADVRVHDPHVQRWHYPLLDLEAALDGADLLLIATGHRAFRELSPVSVGGLMRARLLFDAPGLLDLGDWRAAGFTTARVGRP